MSTGPLTTARDNLSEIIDSVAATGEEYLITRHGRPVAVILSVDEYESMMETINILSDDETVAALDESDEDVAAGRVEQLDD